MKKIWLVLYGMLSIAVLSGCQHWQYASQSEPYIGQSIQNAKDMAQYSGRPFRVVRNNGQPMPVTYDYRPGRINATVVNGVVVNYEVE